MSEPKFTERFLSNKLFKDQMFSFDKLCQDNKGIPADLGAHTLENGDILFRVYAPCAEKV